MSDLQDRVSREIIAAMKAKDKTRLNVLRYLKKLFIENNTAKNQAQEMDIIISHAKKTKDALELYKDGPQREEIKAELVILDEYLPKPMTEDEVVSLIEAIKAKHDKPNMGVVMKELSSEIKGKFDGKRATDLVKAAL